MRELQLQEEPFDPILIYKPQGMLLEEYPTLPKESFIIAVQTEFQVELYRKFSSKILCIDATHSTNAYRFKLITCVVPDEFGQGNATPIEINYNYNDYNRTASSMVYF